MKLSFGPAEERFRAELLEFLAEHTPPEAGKPYDVIDLAPDAEVIPEWLRAWQAKLFDHGWMIPGYPPEFGGRNATPVQSLIFLEEMSRRRIPRATHFPGYAIVAPSLLEYGSEEQRALVPAAVRGDTIWCIGMSEPNAGSDLAGLRTRAEVFADRFVVNGQKVWTSYATVASKCFCYVRTDSDVPKHKGISLLIIDMDSPGIEVRPLRHITGQAEFAEVFFTDVEVPRANLVGPLHGGWALTQGSLAHERAGLWVDGVARLEEGVDALVDLARRFGRDTDPVVRRKVGAAYEVASSLRALGYKGFASFAQGSSAPEHSYMKMASGEAQKAVWELGMEICAGLGAVTDPELGEANGRFVTAFFVSFANTVAGGSSEIQRNIIAQRVLGLPRG